MQKVDIVIGVLGLVAILATVSGVLLFDDGTQPYGFRENNATLASETQQVSQGGTDFTWETPQNATGAAFTVEVLCQDAQFIGSGQVTATVELVAPDNTTTTPQSQSFDVGAGTSCTGQSIGTMDINLTWADVPDGLRGTEADLEDHVMTWSEPIRVIVMVDGPNEQGALLPTQSATFGATVGGSATVYESHIVTPDSRVT